MSDDTENSNIPPQPAKAVHPGSENLKPFQPGVSGNPAGRKPGSLNRKTIMSQYLNMAAQDKFQKLYEQRHGVALPANTIAEQLIAQIVAKALAGDDAAIDRLLDGTMDKVADQSVVSGDLSMTQILGSVRKEPKGLEKFEGETPSTAPTTTQKS